jgi:hypothetical protein
MLTKKSYVEYLVSTPINYTCSNLAEHKLGSEAMSHDAVSNFLKREKFTPRQLWQVIEPHISNSATGFLIVDDSVQDKRYSKFIELVKKQYSGNVHGLVRGIGIVNMVHTSGEKGDFLPNEHFREMFINAMANKGLLCRTILFDSWYSSVTNLKLIHRSGWTFFTTLKSNRMVSLSIETGFVHLQDIEWTDEQLKSGIVIKLKEVPFQVQLFKIVATNGDIEWVITNDLTCENADVVEKNNDVRWQIEELHREIKQLTGIEKCQCRAARAQRNHIACAYHAWFSLKINARNIKSTVYQVQKDLFKPFLIDILANPKVVAII